MGAIYDWQYKVIMDYIKYDLKMKDAKIGVVRTRKEYGKKGLNAVKNRAAKYNIPVVAELVLPTGAVDATSQVLVLQKANANIVVTCDVLPPIISFLKTAEKHNYWPKVFGFNWATDDLLVKAYGKADQNYYASTCETKALRSNSTDELESCPDLFELLTPRLRIAWQCMPIKVDMDNDAFGGV